MNSASIAGFALMGLGALAWFGWAGDDSPFSLRPLCVHGHPAPRGPGVTYGGLAPQHGYERDHKIPLELGGPDVAGNVWYQACRRWGPDGCAEGAAADSNVVERRAERAYCTGKVTLSEARRMVAEQKGLK